MSTVEFRPEAKFKPEAKRKQLLAGAELWCAQDLVADDTQAPAGLPTGFAWLDRLLPDGGWPRAALTEVLCDAPGLGELRLLMSGLAQLSQTEDRWIAWIDPPFLPYAPALAAAGVEVGRVLLVRTGAGQAPPSQRALVGGGGRGGRREPAACPPLWALEQALASGACSAALAWIDERKLRIGDLRRLQLRAKQGGAWAVLFRPRRAAALPSAAELRLSLRPDARGAGNAGGAEIGGEEDGAAGQRLLLSILKRRGGWGMADLPLAFADSIAPQSLLRLWRHQAEG